MADTIDRWAALVAGDGVHDELVAVVRAARSAAFCTDGDPVARGEILDCGHCDGCALLDALDALERRLAEEMGDA